jgi:hypothetical protein
MQIKSYIRFAAAILIYTGYAIYLYQPFITGFNRFEILFPVNAILAAAGCFILSRRWISGLVESILAGAIFGFGPYFLSLAKFHPAAGLLAASMPWFFLPAAYAAKTNKRWISIPAGILPFIIILLFSIVTAKARFFAAPLQASLGWNDMLGTLAPLTAASRGLNLPGFYHVSLAALVFGLVMLIKARRFGVMVVLAGATVLALCDNFNTRMQVSPLLWLSITMLCGSIIIGTAIQGFASAGQADKMWLLYTVIAMGIAAVTTLVLATKVFRTFLSLGDPYAILLVQDAMMYILGAVAIGMVFFINYTGRRFHWLRLAILTFAVVLDIFICASFIVDTIF